MERNGRAGGTILQCPGFGVENRGYLFDVVDGEQGDDVTPCVLIKFSPYPCTIPFFTTQGGARWWMWWRISYSPRWAYEL